MKKLSAAQEKALYRIRQQVEEARRYPTYEEYFQVHDRRGAYQTVEELRTKYPETYQLHLRWWENRRRGLALVQASGPTIRRLEALGYIRIVDDTSGTGSYRSDIVELL